MNTNKISYNKYVAEIIGTLMLVLVVALSGAGLSAIVFAGLVLAFIVYLFGDISGAHVNPAFTIAALSMKKIKWQDAVLYICSQLIGAGLALIILKNIPDFKFTDINALGSASAWKIFMAEIVGMIIFSFGFSAVLYKKTTKSNSGFIVGMGLFFGLLAANIITGGIGVLNPAVAIGTNMLNWATIIAPIIGALIGTWLYRFMVIGSFCGCDACCGKSCGGCGTCKKSEVCCGSSCSSDAVSEVVSEPVIVVEEVEIIN